MSLKKYTYSDWLNGKVILDYSLSAYNRNDLPAPVIVTWDNFNQKEKEKIQKKQETIFNELLKAQTKKTTDDFLLKCKKSTFPKAFIDKELNSLKALWSDRFVCQGGICFSPVKNDKKTFDEWYYKEMMIHIRDCFLDSVKSEFEAVPSPKSAYHNKDLVLPEIMISTVLNMIRFIKSYKKKRSNPISGTAGKENIEEVETKIEHQDIDNLITKAVKGEKYYDLKGYDDRFFRGLDAYKFFLDSLINITCNGRKSKNDSTEQPKSEIAKYAVIFDFMKRKGLINKDTKHQSFIKYVRRNHEAQINKTRKKFPSQYAKRDLDILQVIFENYTPTYLKSNP